MKTLHVDDHIQLLKTADDEAITRAVKRIWADFDLEQEAERVESDDRQQYRSWLSSVKTSDEQNLPPIPAKLSDDIRGILVASAVRFERRARIFREVHPLALQVILTQGILNGILVVRSIGGCAKLLVQLIRNSLDLEMLVDDRNYRLVEKATDSTIRVISRHDLLNNAFRVGFGEPVT